MEYQISEKLLDRVMKNYFDKKFENSTFIEKRPLLTPPFNENWHGFFKDIFGEGLDVILGLPYKMKGSDWWFFHGPYFSEGPSIFNISWKDFNDAFVRYVNKKYPHLNINKIH